MLKNGTFASPAIALANNVLPVPGGPTISTPRGIVAPKRLNFAGSFKKSTISTTSCFASSQPATSAKVTLIWSSESILPSTYQNSSDHFAACTTTHVTHKEHE